MDTVKVVLAGREYEISPLPLKASRVWRQTLGRPVQDMVEILSQAETLQLNNPADLVQILEVIKTNLIGAPDLVFEAVCAYCPAIGRERERLEEEAFDAEILDALVEVLKLAFPFSRLLNMVRRSQNG